MKKTSKKFVILALLFTAACASVTEEGAKVHIEVVDRSIESVEKAQENFTKKGCELIGDIEAPIAMGSSDEFRRLVIGMKNKTAEVGGNAVISSMIASFGMPIYTKGIAYKCPGDIKWRADNV
jgi:hypothetical protein